MRLPPILRCAIFTALAWSATCTSSEASLPWSSARQMVVVTTENWQTDHGLIRTYERQGTLWKATGPAAPVVIGRNGSAWGQGLHPAQQDGPQKHEGDNRSPAGIFRIGKAFGYAATHDTALPYVGLTASDYCMDVYDSPYYNQLVDERKIGSSAIAGSTEPMRRDLHLNGDGLYRLGFVIEHNPERQRGKGSCIFAHLWRSPDSSTAGCTAMTQATMERLLAWLDPKKQPVFVLLPRAEYTRLRAAWQLPE